MLSEFAPVPEKYLPLAQSTQSSSASLPAVAKYVPAGQAAHAAAPDTSLYVPALHAVHDPPPGPEYPVLHVQLVKAVLSDGESEFAGQAVQSEASALPSVVENLPAIQLWQVLPEFAPVSGENLPMLHFTQSPSAALPCVVKYVPARQGSQAAAPDTSLYVPAMHAEHAAPSGPVYPGLHSHVVWAALPAGESEFAGQASHVAAPDLSLYVPALHAVHDPPSGPVHPRLHVQSVKAVLS